MMMQIYKQIVKKQNVLYFVNYLYENIILTQLLTNEKVHTLI